MENYIIKSLNPELRCEKAILHDKQIILEASSVKTKVRCPYCGFESKTVHSLYERELQDIPLQDKQVILLLKTRKMFCTNPACEHKTFAEQFDFVAPRQKKTKRLIEKILVTSVKLSSVNAAKLLKSDAIIVGKSSICDLLKKNSISCG